MPRVEWPGKIKPVTLYGPTNRFAVEGSPASEIIFA